MSARRPDGRYRGQYRDATGVRHSKHFRLKRDADAWETAQRQSVAAGTHVNPRAGRTRVGAYADDWLSTKHVDPSSMQNVRGAVNRHIKPYFGEMRFDTVRVADVRAFIAGLVNHPYAPSTVKKIALTARQIFEQAVEDGIIAKVPFPDLRAHLPADRAVKTVHFLSADVVNELAAALDERYRAAIYLSAWGGLRAGEVWGLHVDQVDVVACRINVVVSASETGGWHLGPTKTNKPREITIPRFLATMLAEHIAKYQSVDGLVFTTALGEPIGHKNFYNRKFQPACVSIGQGKLVGGGRGKHRHYEGVVFHSLRHTCAAFLIANGRHIEEVKEYLGHSTIRVTSDRYGHLFPKARAELADSLDVSFAASLERRGDSLATRTPLAIVPSAEVSALVGAHQGLH